MMMKCSKWSSARTVINLILEKYIALFDAGVCDADDKGKT